MPTKRPDVLSLLGERGKDKAFEVFEIKELTNEARAEIKIALSLPSKND